jgi:hypothetical protein
MCLAGVMPCGVVWCGVVWCGVVWCRWGDKGKEMKGLVPIEEYMMAVESLIRKHDIRTPRIFLTTEDANASAAFHEHAKKNHRRWEVFEFKDAVSDQSSTHSPVEDAYRSHGHMGLNSLIALLLSMEAKYFVLTTASNWSYLINCLRMGVVDSRCGGCTDVIDLKRNPIELQVEAEFKRQFGIP